MKSESKKMFSFNQNQLKWIAVISMTIDHAGMVLFPQLEFMRLIGRLAFPIYCYLLVQGFLHTKSRAKYMGRLGAFALLSELPFDLACYGEFSWRGQSVFVTLFLCLGMLWLMEPVFADKKKKTGLRLCITAVILLCTAVVTALVRCDYSFSAPFLVAGLYFYVEERKNFPKELGIAQLYGAYIAFFIAMYIRWRMEGYSGEVALGGVVTEAFCLPSAWLIQFTGKRRKKRGGKYFFYLYYPLHLLLLYGLSRLY